MRNSLALIVEDEREVARMLAHNLESFGLRPTIAHNTQEALEILFFSEPDLVLIDVRLPDGNGLHIAREIRTRDSTRRKKIPTPIIVITALESLDDWGYPSERATISSFLSKPYSLNELQSAIQKALQQDDLYLQ